MIQIWRKSWSIVFGASDLFLFQLKYSSFLFLRENLIIIHAKFVITDRKKKNLKKHKSLFF